MGKLFVLLLIIFLVAFFGGIEAFADFYRDYVNQQGDVRILGLLSLTSLTSPEFKVFLGGGIVFLEFVIILFSMLDRIVDTIKEIIRPVAKLIPLGAFLTAIYQTFKPIVESLLPQEVVGAAGNNPGYIAQAVRDGSLTTGILLTLGTMILFILAGRALRPENEEVKKLQAELARTRRALR